MLEPFHRRPGKPEGTVLAFRLGVGRYLKPGSVHVEEICCRWFHQFDTGRLRVWASKAKDIVGVFERFRSFSAVSGKH